MVLARIEPCLEAHQPEKQHRFRGRASCNFEIGDRQAVGNERADLDCEPRPFQAV